MAGRSLQASAQGIKRAKLALERNNLTQKALANERAIASWSTVSKFFNGKPVDRSFFIEICEELNLDWEDIVSPFSESTEEEEPRKSAESPHPSDELAVIQHNASRTRRALEPYILPRIRREALLEKCLKAIRRSIQDDKPKVIPIIGSAGYGKSTILGNIYDELLEEQANSQSGWIALARCDDFIESVETFAIEFGEKVSDVRESIAEIAKRLNEQHGRGVLLLDTLDIVLTKPLVPVLRTLLSQLLESGTTIVFTCRDQDYSYFFEPYHESFAGFRESVNDGCKIPPFNDDEVKEAAREFVKIKLGVEATRSAQDFADKIIALSADSQSLQEITRNPLLLALLCELFAQEENVVPEDLTVSQLYAKYWDWKIPKVRGNSPSIQVGLAKEKLCLEIAEAMYNKSDERLRDFIYESDFNLLNETESLAYSELKSDGIIKEIGVRRIVFFHQTFLEYAIARWLNSTDSGERAKNELLSELKASQTAYSKYYIWAVLRQLLTLVNLNEFSQIANELDKTKILPFRSVAFASVSRSEPESSSLLLSLLAIALTKDYAFQEALLIAANSAPNRHGKIVWQVVVELLEKVGKELVNKATEIAAELLTRLKTAKGICFQQALDAVKTRTATATHKTDELYHTYGQLITTYYNKVHSHGEHQTDLDVLYRLKEYYFLFGGKVRSLVIDLYLKPNLPELAQRELLLAIIQKPSSEQFKEKEKVKELLNQLLPNWLSSADSPFGTSWFEALHTPFDKCWTGILAEVVGQKAASDPNLMATILTNLFTQNPSEQSGELQSG
jgi:transcriptional regulator with XRE-family HTH domain